MMGPKSGWYELVLVLVRDITKLGRLSSVHRALARGSEVVQ